MRTGRSHSHWMQSSDRSQKEFKLQTADFRGQGSGRHRYGPINSQIVGTANEVQVAINGVSCLALLDTGATVSTISQTFYVQNLQGKTELHALEEQIDIECADGQMMPYLGFVIINLSTYGISTLEVLRQCMFLVVPDSQYNAKVPILIGTNILNHLLEVTRSEHGSRFLQDADLHTSWYFAFRCLTLMEKQLQKKSTRYYEVSRIFKNHHTTQWSSGYTCLP